MNFIKHSNLTGQHALLGASNYHWINYDSEKMIKVYLNKMATEQGTKLHAFAANCIEMRQKLPHNNKTLNMYVNTAIALRMIPEQILYYSNNCFGTADSICFRDDFLRIHDLKTGSILASMNQLYIYDALFCLEYDVDPGNIKIENRIYQNDKVEVSKPDTTIITPIMDKIVYFDELINKIKSEEE